MNEVKYARWDGEQLTYLQDDRNALRPIVLDLLTQLRKQYECQGWQDIVQPEAIVDEVLDGIFLLQVPSGWVGFSVEIPWFMTKPVVGEEFVCCHQLDDAVEGLTALAKSVGANRVVLGTRAAMGGKHRALARLYERRGCKVSTIELTLEVT